MQVSSAARKRNEIARLAMCVYASVCRFFERLLSPPLEKQDLTSKPAPILGGVQLVGLWGPFLAQEPLVRFASTGSYAWVMFSVCASQAVDFVRRAQGAKKRHRSDSVAVCFDYQLLLSSFPRAVLGRCVGMYMSGQCAVVGVCMVLGCRLWLDAVLWPLGLP